MWTLKYRPQRFADVVGQAHIRPVLKAMVRDGSPHHALIFSGSRGTGKTTMARILAAALNCENAQDGDACRECSHCVSVQKSNSTSVLEIDAASAGGVDNVRQIREICAYAHENEYRVILLDEAHSMSRDAFNALLKTMEEPPENTVFILLTTEAEKIIPTIRSRSMLFDFRRLTPDHIVGRLRHIAEMEQFSVEDGLLLEIARRCDGGMRDAVMLLDQVHRVGVKDAEGFAEMFGMQDISVELLTCALDGNHSRGYALIEEAFYRSGDARALVHDLSVATRDMMVLKAGGTVEASPEDTRKRQELADRLDVRRLVTLSKVLWQLQERTRVASEDQRTSMDIAYALMIDALSGAVSQATAAPAPIAPAPQAKVMDLAALRMALK